MAKKPRSRIRKASGKSHPQPQAPTKTGVQPPNPPHESDREPSVRAASDELGYRVRVKAKERGSLHDQLKKAQAERENYLEQADQARAERDNYKGLAEQAQAERDDYRRLAEQARNERDSYLELAKRSQAELEKLRRRQQLERANAGERIAGDLIRALLPALDNFYRALRAAEAAEQETAEGYEQLRRGLRIVWRELIRALGDLGVETIDPLGERFDPQLHEAIATESSSEEPGRVIRVAGLGYRLGDQVIRPAQVVVSE